MREEKLVTEPAGVISLIGQVPARRGVMVSPRSMARLAALGATPESASCLVDGSSWCGGSNVIGSRRANSAEHSTGRGHAD